MFVRSAVLTRERPLLVVEFVVIVVVVSSQLRYSYVRSFVVTSVYSYPFSRLASSSTVLLR